MQMGHENIREEHKVDFESNGEIADRMCGRLQFAPLSFAHKGVGREDHAMIRVLTSLRDRHSRTVWIVKQF
jgi:hypothetical protein